MVNASAGVIYSSGMEYWEPLTVNTLRVMKSGTTPDSEQITIELLADNSPAKGYIKLTPNLAITLARSILSVAEGYISEAVSKVA